NVTADVARDQAAEQVDAAACGAGDVNGDRAVDAVGGLGNSHKRTTQRCRCKRGDTARQRQERMRRHVLLLPRARAPGQSVTVSGQARNKLECREPRRQGAAAPFAALEPAVPPRYSSRALGRLLMAKVEAGIVTAAVLVI